MIVKKSIPCSFYDIQGMENWLDEMALQGLFFDSFSYRNDYANFQVDNPRPVRYRLDPVGRSKKEDQKRKEPYAQMGWNYVDALPKLYYVFSCADPEAPELHSDPVTLGYALNNSIQQQISGMVKVNLGFALFLCAMLFLVRKRLLETLLFMEKPRLLFQLVLCIVVILIGIVVGWFQIRRLVKTRRLLEQGLPMKAGRRWNRPRFLTVYFCCVVPLLLLGYLIVPDYRPEVCGLDGAELSHPWPTLAQLEDTGPRPLGEEPEVEGHLKRNQSWLVPVQEYASISWEVLSFDPDTGEMSTLARPYPLWLSIQYDQARTAGAAEFAFQTRREEAAQDLQNWIKWTDHAYHITSPAGLVPRDWPGLDRLETAQYTQRGQDAWTVAAQRGQDILVVHYIGFARWEDCLPLFLEALDN